MRVKLAIRPYYVVVLAPDVSREEMLIKHLVDVCAHGGEIVLSPKGKAPFIFHMPEEGELITDNLKVMEDFLSDEYTPE